MNPVYFEIAGVPDKRFFKCSILRSTLSVDACSTNWRRAQTLRPDQITGVHLCRQCPIGASHAGATFVHRSAIFAAEYCPRCRRGGARTILTSGHAKCISCWNRQREVERGRNAKGTRPGLIDRLKPRRLGVIIDHGGIGQRQVVIAEALTRDTLELAIAAMRLVTGRIAFTRPRGGPAIGVAELARLAGAPEQAAPRPNLGRYRRGPRNRSRSAAPVMPNDVATLPQPKGGGLDKDAALASIMARRVSA